MSTHKYLDNTGLGEVWSKIKNLTSRKTASIPFGQVDSTSTSTVFTATVDGITELRDGVCVYLTNGVITSASGWTLNINDLGAKPVYQSMAAAGRITTTFNVAYTALFVYNSSRVDGGCWDYYYGYNSNDNTIAYQVRMNQTINEMYSALTRYKICFTMFDGKLLPSTSVSNSTGTTKTLTTDSFDPYGAIYYYNTTTGVAASESPSASYMWLLYHNVDLRYGFNAGTTLVAKDNVYIKCSPQNDGSVKLAGNDCIVQSLPNTDDGYVYIYLGKAYDTYRMSLDINHPIYYYKGGAIRLWSNVESPDLSNYLAKDNTTSYTPNSDYNPATKKYVDDATASITDEKLSTNTIGSGVYYPIVGTNTASATTKYIDSTGFKYDATSSTNGYARLYLGNGTASGTEGSKYGRLMIYGTTAYAVTLDSGSPTENRDISLPNKNGTIALTSDIPTKVSDLTNDSGFITSYTETDPIFVASAAYEITSSDISNWNSKTSLTLGTTSSTAFRGDYG